MSLTAADWSHRYASGDTPWDLGESHPELALRIASGLVPADPAHRRALVSGCGRGHDALALARAGWQVTAVDFLDPSGGTLAKDLAEHGGKLVLGDALSPAGDGKFDLVFDHTFFCAIDPGQRARWGALVANALAPGGVLAAIVFPTGKPASEGGPPFGMSVADLLEALGREFEAQIDEPVRAHVTRRNWPERWALIRRVSRER